MRVLVTGATGFIGRAIVKELISRNIEVIATARKDAFIQGVEFIPYEINSDYEKYIYGKENLFEYFKKPDFLIHCAWHGLPNYESKDNIEQVENHFYFIQNLVENGLKDFTVLGTCLEYGKRLGLCREDFPARPEIYYAIAKNNLYNDLSDLNCLFKWCRLFYVYGEGQSEQSLLEQIKKAEKENHQFFKVDETSKDFIHVSEASKMICDYALQKKIFGIVNIGSGEMQRVSDFARKYIMNNNFSIRITNGYAKKIYEPDFFYADMNKFKKIWKRKRQKK